MLEEKKLPPREEMDKAMKHDEDLRKSIDHNQFPRGAYNDLVDQLATLCGSIPDFERLKKEEYEIYKKFWFNGVIPAQFCFNQNRDLALSVMNESEKILFQTYEYEGDEEVGSHLNTVTLAKKVSKYFKIPVRLFKE